MNMLDHNLAHSLGVDPGTRLPTVRIGVGQYYVTTSCTILNTTLGSCVSVCLSDVVNRVYGMNHFMLPDPIVEDDGPVSRNARFGAHAMELLINGMLAQGAEKPFLSARIFGGAHQFPGGQDIGLLNTAFAVDFLQREAIPIALVDVGGDQPLRVTWRVPLQLPSYERLPGLTLRPERQLAAQLQVGPLRPIRATLFDTRALEASVS